VEWAGRYIPACVTASNGVRGAGPPGPPINVSGHVTTGSADVTWKPPASDGHSPIKSYVVTGYDAGGNKVGTCTSISPALTCAISTASPFKLSEIYTFKVVAVNSVGHSTPGTGYSTPQVTTASTSPITSTKVQVTG